MAACRADRLDRGGDTQPGKVDGHSNRLQKRGQIRLTLSQFKEMYPPQAGARLLAERTSDMDGFDNMVVYELSLPAPVSMTGFPLFVPYDRLNHWWRVRYWANARRNRGSGRAAMGLHAFAAGS